MKTKIFNQSHFIRKGGLQAPLTADLDNVSITLPRRKLVFTYNGKEIVKYESEHPIEFTEYDDRLICFLKDGKSKKISFEVFGNEQQLAELKKTLILRNRVAMYKSPLQKEYSTKIQESLMVDKNRTLNIRGFVNLGIIFICLNYIRLIIESKTESKFLFIENVRLLVAYTKQKFYRSTNHIFFDFANCLPRPCLILSQSCVQI